MPNENTHIFLAEKILEALPEKIKHILKDNIEVYYLGSIIPDCFFYNKKTAYFSRILHGRYGEKTNKIIFELLDFSKTDTDFSFALGYITHCATDITWHPMVYYFSGKEESDVYQHHVIETFIEKKYTKKRISEINVDMLDDIGTIPVFSRYLGLDAYELMKKLLKRQTQVVRLFSCAPCYYIAKLLRPFIHSPGYLGLFHSAQKPNILPKIINYKHPVTGTKYKKTTDDLVKENVSLGVKMIINAYGYKNHTLQKKTCEKVLSGQSLITGLEGKGINEIKFTKNGSG